MSKENRNIQEETPPNTLGRASGLGTCKDFKARLAELCKRKNLRGSKWNRADFGRHCVAWAVMFLLSTAGVRAQSLDASVRYALGQIETGAMSPRQEKADFSIGRKREVSRYQILPDEWRRGAAQLKAQVARPDPTNPDDAWRVAVALLKERQEEFIRATRRRPTPVEVYILWNAPGQFARVKYDPKDVSWTVRERADRFGNLMETFNGRRS